MANSSYYKTNQDYAEALLPWSSGNWKVALCTATYVPDYTSSGDHYLAVITGGAIVATSANLSSKTNAGGHCDAADVTFSSVLGGSTVTQAVLYLDSGSAATSPLFINYNSVTNFPLVTNGGNVVLQWAGSPNFVWSVNFAGLSENERKQRIWDSIRDWYYDQRGLSTPIPAMFARHMAGVKIIQEAR